MLPSPRFDYDILQDTGHRPWPMPDEPWVMTQSWHDLLFAHWPVDKTMLRELVPPGLPLDLYDNRVWVGVVPFHMTNVAPRGLPSLPFVSAFAELNVRTYVVVDGKPGVYFFSLDAASALAVGAARALFNLPYYAAAMQIGSHDGWIDYRSERLNRQVAADFAGRYQPEGAAFTPERGTLEYFLTERYCLYVMDRRFRVCSLEIHHRPWLLRPARLELTTNTMAEAAGVRLPAIAPLLHFSKRQDMVAWRMRIVG
jgi:uncharacterized protein YqjF (DUF2071 family)